jgi:hypothetical protein
MVSPPENNTTSLMTTILVYNAIGLKRSLYSKLFLIAIAISENVFYSKRPRISFQDEIVLWLQRN